MKRASKKHIEEKVNMSDILRYALGLRAPSDVVATLVDKGLVSDKKATWRDVIVATLIANAAKGSIQHVREIFNRTEGLPQAKISIDAESTIDDEAAAKIFDAVFRKKPQS